jgi:hypothetical protein
MGKTASSVRAGIPEALVLVGAGAFILILGIAAYWQADIRWLHLFQSIMYVVTIVLVMRGSRWGHFIGVSAAGFWDYANIFATNFFFSGLGELSRWAHTGRARFDLLIAVPAWFSNLLVVVGCAWAYARLRTKTADDLGRFLVSFVLTTGFFAAAMALFHPRFLTIFPALLHPRWSAVARFFARG